MTMPGAGLTSALPAEVPVPLYYRLREALRARIVSGELPVGSLFLTEQEVSERYQVSRTTVRQAIPGLVRAGLLVRKQGRWTFVAAAKLEEELGGLTGFSEEMGAHGLCPCARTLSAGVVRLDAADAALLNLPDGAEAYRIVRVQFAGTEPISPETGSYPRDIGVRLAQENLDDVTIYPLLERRYGVQPGEAEQIIEARAATAEEGGQLQCRRIATVLALERLTSDVGGRKIELARGVYPAARYRVRLRRRTAGRAAIGESADKEQAAPP